MNSEMGYWVAIAGSLGLLGFFGREKIGPFRVCVR